MGYPFGKKGWKVYDLYSGELFVSIDVVFFEDILLYASQEKMDKTKAQNLELCFAPKHVADLEGLNKTTKHNEVAEPSDSSASNNSRPEHGPRSNQAQSGDQVEPIVENNSEIKPFDNGFDSSEPFTAIGELTDRGSVGPELVVDSLGRGRRDHKASSHLKDYLRYSTTTKDHTSSNPLQKVSSSKPYPIVNYVTCENFSVAHKNILLLLPKL